MNCLHLHRIIFVSSQIGSFLPHETCYLFNPGLIWLHGLSDALIALAYYAIPLEILYFLRHRRDLPFPWVFVAFGIFILGCGSTHLMDVITLWSPAYWFAGAIKAVTAVASLTAAALTLFVMPKALALRSPAELEELNRKLNDEITERRRAEVELLQSRETLLRQQRIRVAGQLTSGIAHDLNNTLNVITLRLTLLGRDPGFQSAYQPDLEVIQRAVDDATRTVSRVQELARPRSLHSAASVQLSEIIAQAIELARTSIEGGSALRGRKLRIESHLPTVLPPIRGEASELRQVFLNLLLNASEATGEGTIKIQAALEHHSVVVQVLDEGTGIPPEQLTRVFEPFFTTKGPRGTGLGLSVAREIIEAFGGTIAAANRAAVGAVFTLRFPLEQDLKAPWFPLTLQQDGLKPMRLLLIDDDRDNLDALQLLLSTEGHQVEAVSSGMAALERLSGGDLYDLVLCDLGMPGMNGWETAQRIFQLRPNLPFYLLTGWSHQISLASRPDVPIAGIISKPIELDEIHRVVAKHAKLHSLSDAVTEQSK